MNSRLLNKTRREHIEEKSGKCRVRTDEQDKLRKRKKQNETKLGTADPCDMALGRKFVAQTHTYSYPIA